MEFGIQQSVKYYIVGFHVESFHVIFLASFAILFVQVHTFILPEKNTS